MARRGRRCWRRLRGSQVAEGTAPGHPGGRLRLTHQGTSYARRRASWRCCGRARSCTACSSLGPARGTRRRLGLGTGPPMRGVDPGPGPSVDRAREGWREKTTTITGDVSHERIAVRNLRALRWRGRWAVPGRVSQGGEDDHNGLSSLALRRSQVLRRLKRPRAGSSPGFHPGIERGRRPTSGLLAASCGSIMHRCARA
jgi:hypothetical protein